MASLVIVPLSADLRPRLADYRTSNFEMAMEKPLLMIWNLKMAIWTPLLMFFLQTAVQEKPQQMMVF